MNARLSIAHFPHCKYTNIQVLTRISFMLTEKMKFFVGITCFQWGFGHFIIGKIYAQNPPNQPAKNLTAMCSHKPISATHSQSLNKYFCKGISPPLPPDAIKTQNLRNCRRFEAISIDTTYTPILCIVQ
jgi:hypothetical protein